MTTASTVAGGPAIRAEKVGKSYGSTAALAAIDLALGSGAVHALVGENGAGKSTFLGAIAGRVRIDAGRLEVLGGARGDGDPRTARASGICAIYQELTIVPRRSVAENVFLGQPLLRAGLVDRPAMERRTAELSTELGVALDPRALAGSLSVADQQVVEILRALQADARLVLFDEPTAALSQPQRESLYAVIDRLRARGVTVVVVSHNLDEVFRLADTITVFRDGRLVASRAVGDWDRPTLVTAMIGESTPSDDADAARTVEAGDRGPAALRVEGLVVRGAVDGIDLTVHAGEILGIGGLVGSGRSSVLRAIAGAVASEGVFVQDGAEQPPPREPREGLRRGIALLAEDRKAEGIVPAMTAADNIVLGSFGEDTRLGLVDRATVRRRVEEAADAVGLPRRFLSRAAGHLSGGNQQKLLIARVVYRRPRILLADEPTRGIDLGARREILRTLRRLADGGMALIVVSSELEELVELASRVVVLAGGRQVATLPEAGEPISPSAILRHAFRTNRLEMAA